MQNKSSRVFLLLATVLGVLATVTTFVFLESSTATARGPKVKILVAKDDLKPGTILDPDKHLAELDIPDNPDMKKLHDRALLPENKSSYRGKRINNRIVLAGTPVMLGDLADMTELKASPGNVVMSIQAKGANAVSGLLVPGDYVKIFVTRPVKSTRAVPGTADGDAGTAIVQTTGVWETRLALPDAVKVLAVGSKLAKSRQQITVGEQYASVSEGDGQQTVTLEVTEAQAKTVLEMSGAGQVPVTLVICPGVPGAGAPK